jgi:hypothetical protein
MADLRQQDGKRTLRSSGSIALAGMLSRSPSSPSSVAHPKNSIRFTSGNSTSSGFTDNNANDSDATRNTTTLYNYFDVYETPDCRVSSNDPPADGGLSVTPTSLQICNITQYTCASSSSSSSSIAVDTLTIQVPFAYELYYRSDSFADLQHYILPHLEESMLLHLAEKLGIAQCRQRLQRRQRQLNRRRRHLASEGSILRNVQATPSTSTLFVGASIEPRDQVNDDCDQCRTNYTIAQDNGFKYNCVPMRGEMTVFVQPQSNNKLAEEQAIRDTVSLYIQEAMQEDVLVATGYIPKVVYTDEDALCIGGSGGAATAVDVVSSNGGGAIAHWSRLKIGLVAGLASFVLLLLLLLCCCCCLCCGARRRRRNRQRANADSASDSVGANGTVQPRTATRSLGSRRDYRRRPMSPRRGNAMVAPIAGSFSGPMWGAASVDDDGEDGVERCLASRDSLALRGRGPNGKPTYDEESVGTTRTSVASGSVVVMVRGDSDDNDERDSPTVHEEVELLSDNDDDTRIDGEHINADDSLEQSDEEAGTGTMEHAKHEESAPSSKGVASNKAIQAEDFELLDRLAQRPMSPEDDDDDDVTSNSVQTRDYMAARSLSPTSGSQITALAGNLQKRPWAAVGGGTRVSTQQRNVYQGSPGSPPLSPRSGSYSTATSTRLETIVPPTLMYPSMSRQYRSPPPTIDTEAQALSGNLQYPAQYAPTTTPRTPPPVDDRSSSLSRTTMASRMFRSPTATRTRAAEAPLSPSSRSSASTNNSSRQQQQQQQQQDAVVQPENHETFTYGRLAAPILGPHLRSSTYSSVATAGTTRTAGTTTTTGHLAPSSTYGSHATLRTGNLGPRHSSVSPPRSTSVHHQYGGDSVAMMQAPDSFDEEIMGIISEEDEEPAGGGETPYAKDAVHHGHGPATTTAVGIPYHHNSDVLNVRGSYYYPDPDGPDMNDAYVSEDSDSQLSSNDQQQQQQRSLGMGYNTMDEHAKRRLQMS